VFRHILSGAKGKVVDEEEMKRFDVWEELG